MAAAEDFPVLHSGRMTKKGGVRTNWLDRYFELDGGGMSYYETEEKARKLGNIVGFEHGKGVVRISEARGSSGKWEIEIETPQRTYRVRARTMPERDAWLQQLRNWVPGKGGSELLHSHLTKSKSAIIKAHPAMPALPPH
eukprot:SAG22_NODE_286_length_12969_cov_6.982828_4_plen_140_part_00